ncbi:MAG: hypothetical protein ISS72_03150 [Candidatus Brocadiae bacterium]|nr:hypothetical protein [Candidatus Brocadiia bacterium]
MSEPPPLPSQPQRQGGDLRGFLIRVGAIMLAALVVLYAAARWLPLAGRSVPDDVVRWQDAAKHVGEYSTVEGTIVGSYNSGKACFLNFASDWRHTFTAVIFARRFAAFPERPEEHYRGRRVRVTGLVVEYRGKPEIVLDSPDQIEVLD